MPRPFLIDTDAGSDDAVALIMALRHPDVDVKALTVVAGNVPQDIATRNTLIVADLCGSTVPVYSGARHPLERPLVDGTGFHGDDGLGNQHFPDPKHQVSPGHAVDALIEIARSTPGLVLVTLGPLTNIALAVEKAPDIVANIGRCVVMGGAACTFGNVTPAAEYNIWVDPEAAHIVFTSGLPIEMVGWELCLGDYLATPDDLAKIRAYGTPYAKFSLDTNIIALESSTQQTGDLGLSLPDPVTMAIAIDPDIVTDKSDHYVDVETQSELTRGMTVVDKLNTAASDANITTWAAARNAGKISVTWALDAAKWKELLFQAMQ